MNIKEKLKDLPWRNIQSDKYFLINIILSIFINIGVWVILLLEFRPQEPLVILHYNIYFGIDLIGPWYKIYVLPLFGLICLLVNFFLAVLLYKKEKILSYFLLFFSVLIQVILVLAGFFISLQNL